MRLDGGSPGPLLSGPAPVPTISCAEARGSVDAYSDTPQGRDVARVVRPSRLRGRGLDGGRADRSRATRERILEVVSEQLEEGGENAVRVDAVRDLSGVSIGSIYHHFGDRDGLIVAGQLFRYARYAEAEIAVLSEVVQQASNVVEFQRAIRQLSVSASSAVRQAQRWARIGALSSTVGRAGLAVEVQAVHTRLTDEFAAHVAQGQARGLFRSDLDARAVALFIESYSLGYVLNDVDEHPVPEEDWEKVVAAVLDALLVVD